MNATYFDKFSALQQIAIAQWLRLQIAVATTAAGCRTGRVLLHLACSCADHQFKWHLHGIVREFSVYLAPSN